MSEVQSGPGLPMTTSTTRAFFREILPSAMDVVLEVQDRRAAGVPLWPLQHKGGFELIVHGGRSKEEKAATLSPACER